MNPIFLGSFASEPSSFSQIISRFHFWPLNVLFTLEHKFLFLAMKHMEINMQIGIKNKFTIDISLFNVLYVIGPHDKSH